MRSPPVVPKPLPLSFPSAAWECVLPSAAWRISISAPNSESATESDAKPRFAGRIPKRRLGTTGATPLILAALFALTCAPALATDADESALPSALAEVVAEARRDCASFENGELTLQPGAISRPDLDGDSHPDWALGREASAMLHRAEFILRDGGMRRAFCRGGRGGGVSDEELGGEKLRRAAGFADSNSRRKLRRNKPHPLRPRLDMGF